MFDTMRAAQSGEVDSTSPVSSSKPEVCPVLDGCDAPWHDLPETVLSYVFDLLHSRVDGHQDVRKASGVCAKWRRCAQEILLGDTAASRPKRRCLRKEAEVPSLSKHRSDVAMRETGTSVCRQPTKAGGLPAPEQQPSTAALQIDTLSVSEADGVEASSRWLLRTCAGSMQQHLDGGMGNRLASSMS